MWLTPSGSAPIHLVVVRHTAVGWTSKAARMMLESLTWIVVVNGLVQLASLIVIVIATVRNHREIVRMMRTVSRCAPMNE